MPSSDATYDLVILGAGPAGVAAATTAAMRGLSVALVSEGNLLGYGLDGAFKSKSLYEVASSHHAVRFRWKLATTGYDLNFAAVTATSRAGAEALRDVHERQILELGIELVPGRGRFADDHTIAVGDRLLVGRHLVIATGTRPRSLPGVAADGQHILTSDHIVDIQRPIESLVVLGAGVIGCEFASILAALGTRVILIDSAPRIFAHDDPDVSALLSRSFERLHIEVRPSSRCGAMRVEGGRVITELRDGERLDTERALISIGRLPNTDDLNLEAAGVALDAHGYVPVNSAMRTNVPHIYAVGDVGLRDNEHDLCLVHVGEAEGRTAVSAICGDAGVFDTDYVPFIIFTLPMVAGAGLCESEARRRHGDVRVGKWANVRNHRAHALLGQEGFVKLLVGPTGDDRVLGVRAVGQGVDALVGETSVIIHHGLPYTYLLDSTHAHPSLSESLQGAAQIIAGEAPPYVDGEERGDRFYHVGPRR